jgi:peptidoglycan/LPS O-acetylase OafA/YrhL
LTSTSYRPDIDGLRTLAVVPVVLFHAGIGPFTGGYVGVDIFFVISGYLITSIIYKEIRAKNFSVTNFYDRRCRRILPALSAVLLFCIIAGFAFLTPNDYRNLGESILATTFFVSNIYFWKKTGYFEARSTEQPLLHTWSLSIEEQFYVGYPLLLVLLSKTPRLKIPVLLILCAGSLAASIALVYFKPSSACYLGPTRAWELLIGGLVSLQGKRFSLFGRANTVTSGVGLALILAPIFMYTASTRFPGIASVPPVIGAGILIWTGIQSTSFVHKILSTFAFTSIGKASYSLYLWHWPLLVFARYIYGDALSPILASFICLAALSISLVSLWYVEKPFRFPVPSAHRLVVTAAISSAIAVATFGFCIQISGGFPSRMDPASKEYLAAELDKGKNHTECMSLDEFILPPSRACRLGQTGADPTALLWGDSHAMVTAIAMGKAALDKHSAFLFAATADCPVGIGFGISQNSVSGDSLSFHFCEQYNSEMLKLAISSPNIRSVVLSSRWTNWRIGEPGAASEAPVDFRLYDENGVAETKEGNKAIFERGFERLIKELVKAGKTVWIVGPIPQPSTKIPKALYIKHLGFSNVDLDISRDDFLTKNSWILNLFERTSHIYPIHFIWPDSVLCHDKTCPVSENGEPLFFDDNHLSMKGVTSTSRLYDVVF